jgi:hypothetical protein
MDLQDDRQLLRDNERLHGELMAMVRRKERGSEVTFAGSRSSGREIRPESEKRRDRRNERPVDRSRDREDIKVTVEQNNRPSKEYDRGYNREKEDNSGKLRETLDALEYMKKREKALQEEIKSLSQVLIK